MLGTHKFRKGQKVRLSKRGREANLVYTKHHDRRGTVTRVDEFNCPTVLWDGRSTASGYHPNFIEPVPSRKR